jgi:hypothetical protein
LKRLSRKRIAYAQAAKSGLLLGDYRTAVFILEPWKIWLMKS